MFLSLINRNFIFLSAPPRRASCGSKIIFCSGQEPCCIAGGRLALFLCTAVYCPPVLLQVQLLVALRCCCRKFRFCFSGPKSKLRCRLKPDIFLCPSADCRPVLLSEIQNQFFWPKSEPRCRREAGPFLCTAVVLSASAASGTASGRAPVLLSEIQILFFWAEIKAALPAETWPIFFVS